METTPQRHTEYREHREVTNAESSMAGQKCAEGEGNFTIAARNSGWVGKETIN